MRDPHAGVRRELPSEQGCTVWLSRSLCVKEPAVVSQTMGF